MCAYPPSQHSFPHCKHVLRCCANLPHIDIISQESYWHHLNTCNTIIFHVYNPISRCTMHWRHPLDEFVFACVLLILLLCHLKNYKNKIDFYHGDIYCWLKYKFLHSINTKARISPTTCTHSRDTSRWQLMLWRNQTS